MPPFSGRAVGAFAPGTIHIEWIPEPEVVANEMLVTAGRLEDRSSPLALSREVMIGDVRERFESKTDPEGGAWKPWAPSYAARPPDSPSLMIGPEARLMGAATSQGSYPITEDAVFLSTAGWPDYWAAHQFGATRRSGGESAQSNIEFLQRAKAMGLEFVEGVNIEGIGANVLPARPYIGPSFEAQLKMLEIFDQWFSGIINTAFTRGGRTVGAFRGAGGRFARAPR